MEATKLIVIRRDRASMGSVWVRNGGLKLIKIVRFRGIRFDEAGALLRCSNKKILSIFSYLKKKKSGEGDHGIS